jgi:hypothetical protein
MRPALGHFGHGAGRDSHRFERRAGQAIEIRSESDQKADDYRKEKSNGKTSQWR